MKLAILTTGVLPIPASKGGAVENLVVNLLDENEKYKKIDFYIYSIFDETAVKQSKKYKNTKFIFFKSNIIINVMDNILYFFAKNIFKKNNSQSYRYIFQRLSFLNKVSRDLKQNNYDKILLENHESEYLALKWRKNHKKYENKYYYHCHNELNHTYGCKEIMKKTKKFVCVSDYISKTVCNFLELPRENVITFRNCVDEKKFSNTFNNSEKIKIKKKLGFKDGDFVVIFAGRLIPEKGIKELLQAMKMIKEKNIKLMIIGAPVFDLKIKTKYQEEIEDLMEQLKNQVVFTGYINYSEMYKYYNIANIAVLPSKWNDPAPLTVIESLTCGLPIITTNSGGIPEYAINNSAIILDKENNLIENLKKTIEFLYQNDELRKKMSISSKKCSQKLTKKNYYKFFMESLEENNK